MSHQMHLNKGGAGMAARTACGRNILRTPLSTTWAEFKATPENQRCELCAASKYAQMMTRQDAKK